MWGLFILVLFLCPPAGIIAIIAKIFLDYKGKASKKPRTKLKVLKGKDYLSSTYFKETGNYYEAVMNDKGMKGEYMLYEQLKGFERRGAKFLFNVYLPKEDGTTTELDVLMITPYAIFVFESKNYSGWIFGNEKQKEWTQGIYQAGKQEVLKSHFYSPIFQNRNHIRHLRKVLGDENAPIYSVVVFSDNCELKSITNTDPEVSVINLSQVVETVQSICSRVNIECFSSEDIARIKEELSKYANADANLKQKHIDDINSFRGKE